MKKTYKTLRLPEAKKLALISQGLLLPDFGKGKPAVLKAVEHLGYVQIDTLAVVARAHHHTLWSRLPDYKESHLNDLLEKDRSVFEYWSHAASYLPMKDYRFSLVSKKEYSQGRSHWFEQDKKIKKMVLDRIKAEGPLQSKDFEFKRTGPGNWYEWKPAKKALEQLFMEGKLMVAKRQGFQKVYDLAENVLPFNIDTAVPSQKEYIEHLIRNSIRSNGIVEEKEIAYIRRGLHEQVNKVLTKMLKEGSLEEVKVENATGLFVTSPEKLNELEKQTDPSAIQLLSPFDNAIIQRKRAQRFFNFDYQIECYVPEPKRKFGYFCLPVLYGDNFVARFDPKADRATKTFYVKSMHFEKGFKFDETFNKVFAEKLKEFGAFNGCTKIVIEKADAKWKKEIKAMLR